MQCPRCGEALSTIRAGSMEADICRNCAGIWLDRFELGKVDEAHELIGEFLTDKLASQDRRLIATSPRVSCPKHPDVVMMRRKFSSEQAIMIDECPACGGVWLDQAELYAIRASYGGSDSEA